MDGGSRPAKNMINVTFHVLLQDGRQISNRIRSCLVNQFSNATIKALDHAVGLRDMRVF